MQLVQASELLSTSNGQHNAAVLRARFEGVQVLSEVERLTEPLHPDASVVNKVRDQLGMESSPEMTEET